MIIKEVLIVYMNGPSREHKLTLKTVEQVLTKNKVSYTKHLRTKLSKDIFKNKDLILVVGGDGTFLRTSHYVKDETPIMGINSDPKKKEGFFGRAKRKDFDRKFSLLKKGKFNTCKLTRLHTRINNKTLPEPALNEVFIGDKKPYNISNYTIHFEKRQEKQRSSGLIIGTAAGSHAWVRSAGGRLLPLGSKQYQLIVREPYAGRLAKHSVRSKTMKGDCCISVTSEMKNGIVVIDSLSKEYPFKKGSKLVVSTGKPLTFICFGDTTWVGLKTK